MLESNPFPHFIHDDFFKEELLSYIYNKYKDQDHGDKWLTADDAFLNNALQEIAYETLFPVKELLDNCVSNAKNKHTCNLNDSFFRILIKVMDPGTSHHSIHTDADWKQLTTIVYISNQGTGTKFYKGNTPESFATEVEWKQNRGYSFVPSKTSWHNFEHAENATEKRIVVMFTLANKRYHR